MRPRGPQARELNGNLKRIYADGMVYSVMVGTGETYLAAFALALGMGQVVAGLITSVPVLMGAILQLISPWAVRRLGSHRKWVVLCAVAQALSFVPLVVGAFMGALPVWAIFAAAAAYWGTNLATGPAWNTWVGTLVPRSIRHRFFAVRSRAAHVATLGGILIGGGVLSLGESQQRVMLAFAVIFIIASACRWLSSWLLHTQTEPVLPNEDQRDVPLREFIGRMRHGAGGRLLAYMLAVQLAAYISGPYFTPFMLEPLDLSYGTYLMLLATSYSARVIMLPMLGDLARRFGARAVLRWAGIGLIPLSAMWVVSNNLYWLFFIQFTAGAVWAAYELATFLMLFETIHEHERTSVLTTFNLGNSAAMVLGSAVGGVMLAVMHTSVEAYMWVFGLSGLVRLLTVPLLLRAIMHRGDEPDEPASTRRSIDALTLRTTAVRPNLGGIDRPIVPAMPEESRAR